MSTIFDKIISREIQAEIVYETDDILALKGGGDWHTAYLAFYRKLEATK